MRMPIGRHYTGFARLLAAITPVASVALRPGLAGVFFALLFVCIVLASAWRALGFSHSDTLLFTPPARIRPRLGTMTARWHQVSAKTKMSRMVHRAKCESLSPAISPTNEGVRDGVDLTLVLPNETLYHILLGDTCGESTATVVPLWRPMAAFVCRRWYAIVRDGCRRCVRCLGMCTGLSSDTPLHRLCTGRILFASVAAHLVGRLGWKQASRWFPCKTLDAVGHDTVAIASCHPVLSPQAVRHYASMAEKNQDAPLLHNKCSAIHHSQKACVLCALQRLAIRANNADALAYTLAHKGRDACARYALLWAVECDRPDSLSALIQHHRISTDWAMAIWDAVGFFGAVNVACMLLDAEGDRTRLQLVTRRCTLDRHWVVARLESRYLEHAARRGHSALVRLCVERGIEFDLYVVYRAALRAKRIEVCEALWCLEPQRTIGAARHHVADHGLSVCNRTIGGPRGARWLLSKPWCADGGTYSCEVLIHAACDYSGSSATGCYGDASDLDLVLAILRQWPDRVSTTLAHGTDGMQRVILNACAIKGDLCKTRAVIEAIEACLGRGRDSGSRPLLDGGATRMVVDFWPSALWAVQRRHFIRDCWCTPPWCNGIKRVEWLRRLARLSLVPSGGDADADDDDDTRDRAFWQRVCRPTPFVFSSVMCRRVAESKALRTSDLVDWFRNRHLVTTS